MVRNNEVISLKRRIGLFLLVMFLFTGITTIIDYRFGFVESVFEFIFMLVVVLALLTVGFVLWIN